MGFLNRILDKVAAWVKRRDARRAAKAALARIKAARPRCEACQQPVIGAGYRVGRSLFCDEACSPPFLRRGENGQAEIRPLMLGRSK